jgi:hypothetical protein
MRIIFDRPGPSRQVRPIIMAAFMQVLLAEDEADIADARGPFRWGWRACGRRPRGMATDCNRYAHPLPSLDPGLPARSAQGAGWRCNFVHFGSRRDLQIASVSRPALLRRTLSLRYQAAYGIRPLLLAGL